MQRFPSPYAPVKSPARNLLTRMGQARRIGLLGGSFNPAHAGHVHLSRIARAQLKLDEVWWLVSPQNPLKSQKDMTSLSARLAHAQTLAAPHPWIRVSTLETRLGTRYTVDTVTALTRLLGRSCRFVWLMGGDNLAGFHRWKRWERLMQRIPIAVFDRAPFSHTALRGRMALRMATRRLPERAIAQLLGPKRRLPAWGLVFMPRHAASATDLRKTLGAKAFLGHNPT